MSNADQFQLDCQEQHQTHAVGRGRAAPLMRALRFQIALSNCN